MDWAIPQFSLADIPANLSYIAIAFSYYVRGMLWLRILAVIGFVLEAVYFGLIGSDLYTGIVWNLVFILINVVQIARLLWEKRSLQLPLDEKALLLEVLADAQVTIPEFGTVKAAEPPIVILTSNRTREIHDALKRRCLYHWVGYPDAGRELAILKAKVPDAPAKLSKQVVSFVQAIRKEELFKAPGVAETLDWATALVELDAVALDPTVVSDTLGALLKYQDDIQTMQGSKVKELLDQAKAEAGR